MTQTSMFQLSILYRYIYIYIYYCSPLRVLSKSWQALSSPHFPEIDWLLAPEIVLDIGKLHHHVPNKHNLNVFDMILGLGKLNGVRQVLQYSKNCVLTT